MANPNIQFRIDAVLGDTSTLRQQIANLNTQLSLQLDNSQALNAIQQVQTQINNLRNSLNMNLNIGNISGNGNGNGNGGRGGNGNTNIASATLTTETLQQTTDLYSRISATLDGVVQRITVMRDAQGQIVSGTVTVADGIQTWVRNLEFVDGEFQRVLTTGRDNVSTINRSNELYREAVSLINQIAEVERQSVNSTGETATAYQEKLNYLNSELIALMQSDNFNNLITAEQREQISNLARMAVLNQQVAEAKSTDTQRTQQQHSAYSQIATLMKQINTTEIQMNGTEGELRAAYQQKLNILNQQLNAVRQILINNGLINAESEQELNTLRQKLNAEKKISEEKDKQRNATTNTKSFSEQLTNTLKMSLMWGTAYKLWNQISEGIQECIQYAKDYDEALTNIRIVTMGTREETEKLMDTYNEIGQTLGASTTDVASGAVDWLSKIGLVA